MTGEELAAAVIDYRKAHALSVYQLAAKIGSSGPGITRLEETGIMPKQPLRGRLEALVTTGVPSAAEPAEPEPVPLWETLAIERNTCKEGVVPIDHARLCQLLGLPEKAELEIYQSNKARVALPLTVQIKVCLSGS